jgi:hypothetical protein
MKKEYNRLPEAINGVQSVACCGKCRVHSELMFPSCGINSNKNKWNEVSVDFILFDGMEPFLCLEMKNEIKGKKALLVAYCQVLHRAHLFLAKNIHVFSKIKISSWFAIPQKKSTPTIFHCRGRVKDGFDSLSDSANLFNSL